MIDKSQIYKWWSLFKDEQELVEIRVLGKKTYSGYFKDIEGLIKSIERLEEDPDEQIYFTLNCINDNCYGRSQSEKMEMNPKNTTKDNDVVGRKFVLIDLDPKRSTGVNSSEEELEYAHQKALEVHKYLKDNGFNDMIVCMSGNGYHLNIPCAISINPANDNLIRRFLLSLSMMFSDDKVEVDEKVFNPARICKLYGTTAKKGANIPSRPYRLSRILKYPNEIKPTDIEYFRKIADLYPDDEIKPNQYNNYSKDKFDLVSFFNKHNINYKTQSVADGTKYIFDHCFFNDEHKGKDAVIFQRNNGAISYVCQHNSCNHYKWKDVRLKFEPDAYDKKDYYEFQHKQMYYSPIPKKTYEIQKETSDKGNKWLSMKDIKYVDLSKMVAIPTGYEFLDKKIMGLMLGDITVLSGLSGTGKTSWIDCIALNVVQRGYKVAIWSGELQDFRFQGWIDQIAAGKTNVIRKEGYDNFYYAPKNICDKVNNWLDNKLFLYNNAYKNKWEQLFYDIKELVEKEGVQLVILDNLMALDINGYDGDKYSQQTKFINDLKEYAKLSNIHVILVAHPRKEMGFLRKESISGTADLTNLADNVIILHRIGKDFETRAGEFFGKDKIVDYLGYSTVIELCKNRSFGIVDLLVGMYYEQESRRLKNTIAEHIRYGWEDAPKPQPIFSPEPTTWHNQESKDVEENDDGLPFSNDRDFPFGKEIDEVPF